MLADAGLTLRRRPGWPLALTLGLHLVLGWWWLQATGVRVLPAAVPALREFIVVAVLAPAPSRSSTAPAAAASARPRAKQASAARAVPAVPAVAPAVQQPVTPAPAAISEPAADLFSTPSGAAQDSTATGDDSLASRGKATAGAIDHDLRKGKLAPLEPGDNKWERFAQAVGDARVDTSRTLTSESYTGPDGVVYRFRLGGRTWCRTGGDIRPSPFGAQAGGAALFDKAGGGGFAGMVQCPTRVQFKPD